MGGCQDCAGADDGAAADVGGFEFVRADDADEVWAGGILGVAVDDCVDAGIEDDAGG